MRILDTHSITDKATLFDIACVFIKWKDIACIWNRIHLNSVRKHHMKIFIELNFFVDFYWQKLFIMSLKNQFRGFYVMSWSKIMSWSHHYSLRYINSSKLFICLFVLCCVVPWHFQSLPVLLLVFGHKVHTDIYIVCINSKFFHH